MVSLILDRKIKGKIDQVNGILILDRLSVTYLQPVSTLTNSNATASQRYEALDQMALALSSLNAKISSGKIAKESRHPGFGGMAAFG